VVEILKLSTHSRMHLITVNWLNWTNILRDGCLPKVLHGMGKEQPVENTILVQLSWAMKRRSDLEMSIE